MPVGPAGKNPIADLSYDASLVKSATRMWPGVEDFLEPGRRVATLRSERDYLITIYDVSSAEPAKTLPRQFVEKYDDKKVRNRS